MRPAIVPFNHGAHIDDRDGQHVKHIVWTGPLTDETNSSPYYPTFGGRIVGWRANVSSGPSDVAVQVQFLIGGNDALDGGNITIPTGSDYGYKKPPSDYLYFYPDVKLSYSINQIGNATGPLIVVLEYVPG